MAADSNNISPEVAMPGSGPGAGAPRYRYSSGAPVIAEAAAAGASMATAGAERSGIAPLALVGQRNWNRVWLVLCVTGMCVVALYPSELLELLSRWYSDAGWSHGFVVPLISLFLIREKWDTLRVLVPRVAWVGLFILLLGVAGQVLFRATGTTHMSNLSILMVLLGVVLFVFGWDYLKILWLPISYLVFALPPPNQFYARLTSPMQTIAAEVGCWFLPLFGCEGHRTGTIIEIAKGSGVERLDVEQACSGMRMLVAFFALAVALAYSTSRPMWQKVFLAGCALPIAILCNALRVTLTGVLVVKVGKQWGEGNAHAYFGLLMLIPAMFLQLGMAWVLDHLFVETDMPADAGGRP